MDDEKLVRVLKALADPKRFRIVKELVAAGELSCGQIGERFELSQPAISHHLKLLIEADVLVVRNAGQHHFMSVNEALLDEAAALLPARASGGKATPARTVARTGVAKAAVARSASVKAGHARPERKSVKAPARG